MFDDTKIVCDNGLISEDKIDLRLNVLQKVFGELYDIYCVAKNKKPLAMLDYTAYGRRKLRSTNVKIKNELIKYCNGEGIEILHNKKIGGMYLKTIFFLPKNYNKALKLMAILWYPELNNGMSDIDNIIATGVLLGYSNKNIIYFIKKNYKIDIKSKDITITKKKINSMKISIEDFQPKNKNKIVHLREIELLRS